MFGHGFNTGLSIPGTLADMDPTIYLNNYERNLTSFKWNGTPSNGVSKDTYFNFDNIIPPKGINFNSNTSVAFNGVTDHQNLDGLTIYNVLTVSGYSIDSIVQFKSLAADLGNTTNPGIIVDTNGVFGLTVSSLGVQAWHYTGITFLETPEITTPLNTKLNIQSIYDGTDIKCRVNGGAWQSVAATNLASGFNTSKFRLGTDRLFSKRIDADLARLMTFKRTLSQSELDMLYQDAKISYGV